MAGLRKLRGKFYARVTYTKDGQRREKLVALNTKQRAKAEKMLPDIEHQEQLLRSGDFNNIIDVKPGPAIQPLIDGFIEHLQRNGRSEKTIGIYNISLDSLSQFINGNIDQLTDKNYDIFLDHMKNRFSNSHTLNMRLRNVKTFLRYLAEKKYIKANPWHIKQLPTPQRRPIYFTDSEMNTILKAAKEQSQELHHRIFVHWRTGLRLREIHSSYLDKGFIITFDPCKHGIERDIPIDATTAGYYTWLKENARHIDGTISKMFLSLLKDVQLHTTKSGDKRKFHTLRHTFAVRTYFQTRDIYNVSKLMGHSTVKTTQIYENFNLSKLSQDFTTDSNLQDALNKAIESSHKPIKPSGNIKPLTIDTPINSDIFNEIYQRKYTA